jgi:hypothetical protein
MYVISDKEKLSSVSDILIQGFSTEGQAREYILGLYKKQRPSTNFYIRRIVLIAGFEEQPRMGK